MDYTYFLITGPENSGNYGKFTRLLR